MTTESNSPDATDALPLFPFARRDGFDLPEQYARAHAARPVLPVRLWNGQRAWLLTKHADFVSVLTDPRFSSDFSHPDFPSVTEARRTVDKMERAFVGMDSPRHGAFRRMVTGEFTTRRMRAMRPEIEAIADDLLDRMERAGPPVDLVAALAVELPALVMCLLFGSPYEDHAYISACAAGRHGLTQSPEQARESAEALFAYCRALIDEKEARPKDDMISRVIRDQVRPGHLSRDDFAHICAMIARAGHDTTTNMIGLGTLLFLQHPDQLDRLKHDPALVGPAVEELLRYLSPVQFTPRRVALETVDVNGAEIRAGDGVFALAPAANRDADEFEDPDRFDITRDAASHMAFGHGIHRCLGQILARIELQVVFAKLFHRFPGLALAQPFETIPFKGDSQIYGVHRLMVGW